MENFVHFSSSFLLSYLHSLKLMSHTCVCNDILLLHLIQNPVLNQKSSLNYICHLVFPFLLPIAVLSWSCPVSELAALVRAFAVDFCLVYSVPCRRDSRVPIHIYLLWDCLLVSLLLVPPSGREWQCHPSYFVWLDNLLGEATVLSSNRLPDILPVPGHGVSALTVGGTSLLGFGRT